MILSKSLNHWKIQMHKLNVLLKPWNIKNKKQECRFIHALLAPLAASLVQPVISLTAIGINGRSINGRGVRRAGRGGMNNIF